MRASKNMLNYVYTILVEGGYENWIVSKNQEELIIANPATPHILRHMSFFPSSTDVSTIQQKKRHTPPTIHDNMQHTKNMRIHRGRELHFF